MNKIQFLKAADRLIGKPLVLLLSRLSRDQKRPPADIKSILIIRPGGIGDAVLLLPAIKALKRKFPDCRIDILCEKRNAEIFSLSKEIHNAYLYDRDLGLFRCLGNKYDAVIDTEQWHRLSAVIARLAGARIRIGFATNERENLFTYGIPYSHDDHEVHSFLRLLEPLTGTTPEFLLGEPFIDDLDVGGQALLSGFSKGSDRIVSIFPGASVVERRWGGERFGKVARVLSDKGYTVLILGSSGDGADAEKIKSHAGECIDLTGKTALRDVAVLLSRSALLVTADSGIMHIAYGLGTPTVSLFGSGIEEKWAPRGGKNRIITKRLPCSPCTKFGYTPRCTRNVECLSSISVDEVVEAIELLVKADNPPGEKRCQADEEVRS